MSGKLFCQVVCFIIINPFCCVIFLWLVIALNLFVHMRVECVLLYSGWMIFMSIILTLNFASNYRIRLRRPRKWWRTFMVVVAWAIHVVMNSLSNLRMASSQHIMSHVWYGLHRHVTTLMSHKFVKSYVLIVIWQCGK
jgi:hypothetical protein